MTTRPDWLDEETAEDIVALFRKHGVSDAVSVIPAKGSDEVILLVTSRGAAHMQEALLTVALMDRLSRKVWITTDASAWPEVPISLTTPRGRGPGA